MVLKPEYRGTYMTTEQWHRANDHLERSKCHGCECEPKPRRKRHIESTLQQECVKWFRLQYPRFEKVLFAIPNGGARSNIEAGILKAEGVTPGVADLILLLQRGRHNALCIEMKTEARGSKQNDNQRAWQKAVEENGSKYIVCRTIDEFMAEVKLYINK